MKPPCKPIGENGNLFNLIAIVSKTLKKNGLMEDFEHHLHLIEIQESGGSYDDALNLFSRYVEVE